MHPIKNRNFSFLEKYDMLKNAKSGATFLLNSPFSKDEGCVFLNDKGDVERDEEGQTTMKVLGENMAWLMKRLYD